MVIEHACPFGGQSVDVGCLDFRAIAAYIREALPKD